MAPRVGDAPRSACGAAWPRAAVAIGAVVVAVHAAVVAPTPVLAGALAVEFGVKRLLLLGAQGGVEGFHGFIALVGLGGVLARSSRMRSMRSGVVSFVQFLEVGRAGARRVASRR